MAKWDISGEKRLGRWRFVASELKPGEAGGLRAFFETRIGSALLTFLFTSLLTALVGGIIAESQKSKERVEAALIEQARERREFRKILSVTLDGRYHSASLLRSSLTQPSERNRLDERWLEYQRAYTEYQLAIVPFSAALDDLAPEPYLYRASPLALTLDNQITPAYGELDSCLTAALHAWTRAETETRTLVASGQDIQAGLNAAAVSARPILQRCIAVDQGTLTAKGLSERLGKCLGTFQREVRDVIDLKDKHVGQAALPWWDRIYLSVRSALSRPTANGCKRRDVQCHRQRNWEALPRILAEPCKGMLLP